MTEVESLIRLYKSIYGSEPATVTLLAGAGSSRSYYRLMASDDAMLSDVPPSVIGTVGTNQAENRAFIKLAYHFATKGLPIPHVIARSDDDMIYLQSDLGDKSLYDVIANGRASGVFTEEERMGVERAIRILPHLQMTGAEGLDFSCCFPSAAMDSRMIRWDLNYFKYSFLRVAGIEVDEVQLEYEFDVLFEHLNVRAQHATTFMVRDFQSRNVMLGADGKPYVIDFQGGRRGPVEYDVASFLWQAKANFDDAMRAEMILAYISEATTIDGNFDEDAFQRSLPYFVLFRMLQTLGAYGQRGLTERKAHFMASIPMALHNLTNYLSNTGLGCEFPYIANVINAVAHANAIAPLLQPLALLPFAGLTVMVSSFSYRRGLPVDVSGNGGGYVFDCRAIHNPGRYDEYKPLTGRDEPVKQFLENDGEILSFLGNVYALVDASVEKYLKRGFTSLSVSFGCTGGRHRSVYSAEAVARHIVFNYPNVRVVLHHREQNIFEVTTPDKQ